MAIPTITEEEKAVRAEAPFQLFPYKEQLLLQTRYDIRSFVPFIGQISQSRYKKRNIKLDVKDIAQKETDLLYPAFCIEEDGDFGYIFYYDSETKLIHVVKYHLGEETVFKRQTIRIELPGIQVIRQLYAYVHSGQVILAYLKENSENNRSIIQTQINKETLAPDVDSVLSLNKTISTSGANIISFKYYQSVPGSRGRIYYFLKDDETLHSATAFSSGRSEGGIVDNGVVRLRNPKAHIVGRPNSITLYDYFEWTSIDDRGYDQDPRPLNPDFSYVMWSPQTGFFITGLKGEVEGHLGANLVPLEVENVDFPKMSYYGDIHTYWQEDKKGRYYKLDNIYYYDPFNKDRDPRIRKRYTKKYFFPILESGQIETEVTEEPQQTDNLLLPPIYTRPFRPLGVKLVSYCYDCTQIEVANIGNQMVLAGATIDYYDSVNFAEKFFLEKPTLTLDTALGEEANPEAWRFDTTQYQEPTYKSVSEGSIKSFDYKPKFEYGISFPEIELTVASSGAVKATNTTSGAGSFKYVKLKTYDTEKKVFLGDTEARVTNAPYINFIKEEDLPNSIDNRDIELTYDPNVFSGSPAGKKALIFKISNANIFNLPTSKVREQSTGESYDDLDDVKWTYPQGIIIKGIRNPGEGRDRIFKFNEFVEDRTANTLTCYSYLADNENAPFKHDDKFKFEIPYTEVYSNSEALTNTNIIDDEQGKKKIDVTSSIYRIFNSRKQANVRLLEAQVTDVEDLIRIIVETRGNRFILRDSYNFTVYTGILNDDFPIELYPTGFNKSDIRDQINDVEFNGFDSFKLDKDKTERLKLEGILIEANTETTRLRNIERLEMYLAFSIDASYGSLSSVKRDIEGGKITDTVIAGSGDRLNDSRLSHDNSRTIGNKHYLVYEFSVSSIDRAQTMNDIWHNAEFSITFRGKLSGNQEALIEKESILARLQAIYSQTYKNVFDSNPATLVPADIHDSFGVYKEDVSDVSQLTTRLKRDSFRKIKAVDSYYKEGERNLDETFKQAIADEERIILSYSSKTVEITTIENLLKATIYKYICRYKWVDNLGLEHRSQWSDPLQVVKGNNVLIGKKGGTIRQGNVLSKRQFQTAPVYLRGNFLHFSRKKNISIEIYRTWNRSNTYRHLATIKNETTSGVSFYDATENQNKQFFEYEDKTNDNKLGQVVNPNNILINGCRHVTRYRNRFVFYGFPERKNTIIISSPIDPTKNIAFSLEQTGQAQTNFIELVMNEDVLKVAAFDQILLIGTKNDGFYYWQLGQSPDPIPITQARGIRIRNDFNPPSTGVTGAVILVTDLGIVTLNNSKVKIHDDVKNYVNEDIDIISFANIDDNDEVRAITKGEENSVLVYNHRLDRWSVLNEVAAVSQCVYKGKWAFVNQDGDIYIETDDEDNNKAIDMEIETGWIQLDEVEGYKKISDFYLIGQTRGLEALSCDIQFDGEENKVEESYTIDIRNQRGFTRGGKNINGKTLDDKVDWRFDIRRQTCSSIKLRFRVKSKWAEFSALKFGLTLLDQAPQGVPASGGS